ncbi:MAG TPA: TIGR01897 family CRISPR-associated protein [Thermodesulfobium narugense]|nr:TIGR01897 family CRISPR-associated protein [Thermodesulfobium narugense]
MKRFIYQIGRFDFNYMNEMNFVYENKNYKKYLSSFALKEYFGKDTYVVLIYPVSIVYNNDVVRNLLEKKSDSFAQKVESEIDNYLLDPKEFLKNHPHNEQADGFIVIHSFGEYKKPNDLGKQEFKSTYDDIVLEILVDLIERYLEVSENKEETEFYFDISSGHNIYISAMLESARHFSVFSQLMNWLNKNLRPKIYLSFSDPILGSLASVYNVYIQSLTFQAFFSSPLKKEDIDGENKIKISKKLFPDIEDENEKKENRRKRKILEDFLVFFSAIKNNTPLVLYHFEYNNYNEIINLLKEILVDLKDKFSNNWQNSPKLSKDDYLKAILSLGFYAGIAEVLFDNDIKKCSDGVGLDKIKNKFGSYGNSIYEYFGLKSHIPLLGDEIHKLEEEYKVDGKTLKEVAPINWTKLKEFVRGEREEFVGRNFIAHAGFERTITEIKGENGKLHFRYDNRAEEKIKNVLKEYMGA